MSRPYAVGKRALALCDKCGRTVKKNALKREIYAQRWTGFLVCNDCFDLDHPQLMLGRFKIDDPIALFMPRPDWVPTQGLCGWNPLTGISFGVNIGTAVALTAPPAIAAPPPSGSGFPHNTPPIGEPSIVGPGIVVNFNLNAIMVSNSAESVGYGFGFYDFSTYDTHAVYQ